MSTRVHRAVLLAAGRGQRMMPLTAECPKPMICLAGRPIIERILLGLRAAGIDDAVIIYGYLGHVIQEYFGDGRALGMRLHYREQQELSGTAGAMLLAEELCGDEPVMLHWGDILVDPANYAAVLDLFTRHDAGCAFNMNWVDDPYAGGAVHLAGDSRVIKVVEKPPRGTGGTHWIIAGVIVFAPQIWRFLHAITPPATGEYYVTEAMQRMIEAGYPVYGRPTIGERIHLTSPECLERLQDDPRLAAWEQAIHAAQPV